MAVFGNRTVNLLNLHYGIHSLALSGGGSFVVAYLLRAGNGPPAVLTVLACILAGRFVFRPFVLAPAVRFGLKPLVIAGAVVTGLQYPLLADVQGANWQLLALVATSSLGDAVYWTCYHAYFAALGDADRRGREVGVREAIAAAVGVVAPLATGWALTLLGPRAAFDGIAVVLIAGALPLLGTPDVAVARRAPDAVRAAVPGIVMFAVDGWIATGFFFVWQIALFVAVGESYTAYGGAMALAAVAGAAGGVVLGRAIDTGHGRRAVWLASGSLAAVTGLRAAATADPVLAIVANAAGAVVPALYMPTMMTAIYNQAKVSPCALRFHIATEGGWDAGGAGGCLTAAAALRAGAPVWLCILLSLPAAAASLVLMRRYYRRIERPRQAEA